MAVANGGGVVVVLAGGADLAVPHHAYQSAMVAAVTGAGTFARRAFRVGVVGVDGAKMAKSTGNLVLVQDVLGSTSGAALRMLLLDRALGAGLGVSGRRPHAGYPAAGGALRRGRPQAGIAEGGRRGAGRAAGRPGCAGRRRHRPGGRR